MKTLLKTLRNQVETLTLPANQLLEVSAGRLVFNLLRGKEAGTVGIIEGNAPHIKDLDLGFNYSTAMRTNSAQPVQLRAQERVVLGRSTGVDFYDTDRGIVIYTDQREFDPTRTDLLADRPLRLAINRDRTLSNYHAEIRVGEDHAVTIEDFASMNGTHLTWQPIPQI